VFARVILETNPDDVPADLFDREIEVSDFHAVTTALINDEDDEKASIYAQTLKTLLAQEVADNYRRFIIRTVRALTWTELELARRIYVYNHFRVSTYTTARSNPAEQVTRLLATPDALTRAALQSLRSSGLLAEPPANLAVAPSGRSSVPPTPQPTDLLEAIVTAAYPAEALLPAAFGLRERSPIADLLGVFFALKIEEDESRLVARLEEELFKSEITSLIANPAGGMQVRPIPQLKWAVIIAIGISRSGSPVAAVRENIDLAKREVAVILLPDATDDPTIVRSHTLDLRSGRVDDPAAFVTWVTQRLHAHLDARARGR
jgi:ribosomal protein S19E (S16A)